MTRLDIALLLAALLTGCIGVARLSRPERLPAPDPRCQRNRTEAVP